MASLRAFPPCGLQQHLPSYNRICNAYEKVIWSQNANLHNKSLCSSIVVSLSQEQQTDINRASNEGSSRVMLLYIGMCVREEEISCKVPVKEQQAVLALRWRSMQTGQFP